MHGTQVQLSGLVPNPKHLQKCSVLNTLGAEALVKFPHLRGKELPEQPLWGGVGVGSSLPLLMPVDHQAWGSTASTVSWARAWREFEMANMRSKLPTC